MEAFHSPGARDLRMDVTVGWVSSLRATVKGSIKNGPAFTLSISKVVFRSRMRLLGKLHRDAPLFFSDVNITAFERPSFEMKVKVL